jgi:hypothetical protein
VTQVGQIYTVQPGDSPAAERGWISPGERFLEQFGHGSQVCDKSIHSPVTFFSSLLSKDRGWMDSGRGMGCSGATNGAPSIHCHCEGAPQQRLRRCSSKQTNTLGWMSSISFSKPRQACHTCSGHFMDAPLSSSHSFKVLHDIGEVGLTSIDASFVEGLCQYSACCANKRFPSRSSWFPAALPPASSLKKGCRMAPL